MKILTLTNLYPPHYVGGYELRCRDVTEALRQDGHDVRVLTSDHGVEGAATTGGQAHVQRRLKIHGLFGHPWLGIRKLAAQETHNNQVLRKAVADFRPDVVHVWCMGGLSKSLCHTLKRSGLPVVYDVSDHWVMRSREADVWLQWWNRRDGGIGRRCVRAVWSVLGRRRALDAVAPTAPVEEIDFTHSYFTSARLRELTVAKGYAVDHAAVVHCPVDTDSFHGPVRSAGASLERWLWVGRIEPDKGIHTALRALERLAPTERKPLHVYGRGEPDYVCSLRTWADERQLPVTWHSAQPHEMPEVYRQHDALLFTSEWEEPFALTPLEAMACGTPVIGTMTGGSRELFRHGENALTYDAGDAEQLAERMRVLGGDGSLRARLSCDAQAEVRRRFSLPEITRQIEARLNIAAA